jgi:hypothetical protein
VRNGDELRGCWTLIWKEGQEDLMRNNVGIERKASGKLGEALRRRIPYRLIFAFFCAKFVFYHNDRPARAIRIGEDNVGHARIATENARVCSPRRRVERYTKGVEERTSKDS